MNAPSPKQSLIIKMAAERSMEPVQFAKTIRAVAMRNNNSDEDFAALMLTADRYGLDPLLKEIYAYPAKGGGIVPIVGYDGWVTLANRHPQMDGVSFKDVRNEASEIIGMTCMISRKDRSKPIELTEWLVECERPTQPWKDMPGRMLRNRAFVQCARLAFGFGGIYDPEEAESFTIQHEEEPIDITPQPPKRTPPPAPNNGKKDWAEKHPLFNDDGTRKPEKAPDWVGKPAEEKHDPETGELFDGEAFLTDLDDALASAKTKDELATVFADFEVQANLHADKQRLIRAHDLLAWHGDRITKGLKT